MSRINTNINSLQAQRALRKNNDDLSTRLTRLSTGLKINTGKDGPAALIASETLRSEKEGLKQAIDNSARANNIINTAEGSLAETSNLLLELQSLTNEAANTGALSPEEIQANQLQTDEILSSINRISNTTQFNGRLLLNGQLDYQLSGVAQSALVDVKINAAKLPDNAGQQVTVDVTGSAQTAAITYAGATVSATTIEIGGKYGVEQLSFASGTAVSAVAYGINQLTEATGVSAVASAAGLSLNSTDYGSRAFVTVEALDGTFATSTNKDNGQDATVNINGVVAEADGLTARVKTGGLDAEIKLDAAYATNPTLGSTSFDITGGGARFQIGSDVTRQGQISVGLGSVSTSRLGNFDVGFLSTIGSGGPNSLVSGNTTQAQRIVDAAISEVATLRGRLGAVQKSVLETNINSLSVTLENVTAAESNIRDADFAEETAKLTRAQILAQANTSVLAQANQAPQQVLSLLQ